MQKQLAELAHATLPTSHAGVKALVRRDIVSHVDLLPSRNSRDTIRISARCPVGKHQKYGTGMKIYDSRSGRSNEADAAWVSRSEAEWPNGPRMESEGAGSHHGGRMGESAVMIMQGDEKHYWG